MSRPLLPPRGIFTGTRWLYDLELSATVKETLLQVMALAWGKDSHTTPPLSYAQLEALTGKNARTLRGHLSALRSYQAALRLQPAGTGQFIIALAPWLFTNVLPQSGADAPAGKILPQPVNDQNQEEDSTVWVEREFLDLPEPDHDQARGKTAARTPAPGTAAPGTAAPPPPPASGRAAKPTPPAAKPRSLSKKLQARLGDAGVFPVLLPEVAERAASGRYSETELTALLDWCADDQPERPAALFIGRLRAGARAPSLYRTPPCKRCGQRGKHAQECPERYGPMDY